MLDCSPSALLLKKKSLYNVSPYTCSLLVGGKKQLGDHFMRGHWRNILGMAFFLGVAGCAVPWASRLTLPDRSTLVRGQLAIHSDYSLPAHHRLFDEIIALRGDMAKQLWLPTSDETIDVYLFESEERYRGFMKLYHPEFPTRRACFVGTDTHLTVYAQWGDRIAEDLRHEVTHAYLHASIPNIPLWLDEGLAKFFEQPRGQRGMNRDYIARLQTRIDQKEWRPNLRRLERLAPDAEMSLDDYDEAWAWVHLMLEGREDFHEVLNQYLKELRQEGSGELISTQCAKLVPGLEQVFLDHLTPFFDEKKMAPSKNQEK
jgi:hypothetical protein